MDVILQQFLRGHRAAIHLRIEQAALAENNYFAQLAPAIRRPVCDHYTDLIIHSILQGYIERDKIQTLLAELAPLGILPSEVLAQAAGMYAELESYIRQELGSDPAACDVVLRRMQQAYGSLVAKLTLNVFDQRTGLGRHATAPGEALLAPGQGV